MKMVEMQRQIYEVYRQNVMSDGMVKPTNLSVALSTFLIIRDET